MHRYLRCAFSVTNWLTVFCLSPAAEVFLSVAAAVVNYSVSLQLIMAAEKGIGKERRLLVVVCDTVWSLLNLELFNSTELNQIEFNQREVRLIKTEILIEGGDGDSQVGTVEKKNQDTEEQSLKKEKEKGKKRANTDVRTGCLTRERTNYHSRAALFSHAQHSVTVAA